MTKLQDEWLNNTTVKVLVQNVQVLGTILPSGRHLEPSRRRGRATQNIAILSVTPQQAELVRFAQLGRQPVPAAALPRGCRGRGHRHHGHHAP